MIAAYEQMSPLSRVWIYQSTRELSPEEAREIQAEGEAFAAEWTAHSSQLKANFHIRYYRFLILMVDEEAASASGCSIDKSLALIRQMESRYGISLLDRMNFAYRSESGVVSCPRAEFERLAAERLINDDTIVFNNLVSTRQELESNWEIPVSRSWHRQLVG
jgi:hypothetical protein